MNELDGIYMRVGQRVRLWVPSARDQSLKGRVATIAALGRPSDFWSPSGIAGKRVFQVGIQVLDSRPELLRPGMTADFEVVQREITDTVRVPLTALFRTDRRTQVFVKRGERFAPRLVKVRERDANEAAIASGLAAGEVIALRRPPSELLEGNDRSKRKPGERMRRVLGVLF
jgi:multidrug efflux pump subunit AcrA (membrane-fusion protein)